MKFHNRILNLVLICGLLLASCSSLMQVAATPTSTLVPTVTVVPSPTPRPERNVAQLKPVRVSASWVGEPPERAVNGNLNDWWGAGGPVPQWIEIDLEGIYSVSRIRIINEGPTGGAPYQVFGRGPDSPNRLLHVFDGIKSNNQRLEFAPETPWEGISTIRIEINSGSGWVGFREVQVFSRDEPKPLPALVENAKPLFEAGIDSETLAPITQVNAIYLKPLAVYGRGPIRELAWSPDGKILAVASPLGIWLYDSADLRSTPRLLQGHTRDVLSAVFSPDGMILFSASQDGTVRQWDVASGASKRTFHLWDDFTYEATESKREREVWNIAFSPDASRMAAATLDGSIRVWDMKNGQPIKTLKGHTRQIWHLAFSPDGSSLASHGVDGSFFIWDVAAGLKRKDLSSQERIQAIAFDPQGSTLAYGGIDMPVRLLRISDDQAAELSEHKDVLSLEFKPDGSGLLTSNTKGELQFWDVETRVSQVLQEKVGWLSRMKVSPDGALLATTMWNGPLQMVDLNSGIKTDVMVLHTSAVHSIALSKDGQVLASGGEDGIIWLWDPARNDLRGALLGHGSDVTGLAFSPEGSLIASSSFDRTVRVWNARTLKQVSVLEGHESYVRCVAFSPDGKTIASGSTDQTVRLWDAETGTAGPVLRGHTGEIESVTFSSDGRWLASASADKTIRVWDMTDAQEPVVLHGNLSFVNDVAFHPETTLLASAGADHSLRFWDWSVSSGAGHGMQRLRSVGHPGWNLSVDFSPDGKLVALANLSTPSYWVTPGEIHIYSSDSAYPFALLRGHTKRVTSVAFSADGKLLVSGSADGSVRIWGVVADDSIFVSEATLPPTPSQASTDQPTLPPTATDAPTIAPTPIILPKSGNLALRQVTTTSNSESARPSDRAVDGSTSTDWGSGDFPPQWIEIDLGAPATVNALRLLITQNPSGTTSHRILLRSADGDFVEVHRFEGFTSTGQWLMFRLPEPMENIQYVRVETIQSPSWVGWVEIEVIGQR